VNYLLSVSAKAEHPNFVNPPTGEIRSDVGSRPKHIEPIHPENIERVLRVIASYFRHPIPGIRHKAILGDAPPHLSLLDIPASPVAPRQVVVKDHRYYRRHGAVSDPMAHDLVELYFGRRLGPVLTAISRGAAGSHHDPAVCSQEVRQSHLYFRASLEAGHPGPRRGPC
jgi:hypothetical protein